MRSALDAWIAGDVGGTGFARHSSNGGTSWTEFEFPGAPLATVRFLSGGVGFAAGAGIQRTLDNGAHWSVVAASDGLRDLHFVDGTTGHACGVAGLVLRTTDAGANWVDVSPAGAGDMAAVHFVDPQTGWVVGAGGAILFTFDGGQSWAAQTSGTRADLADIEFVSSSEGWVSGEGVVLRTLDAGATWSATAFPANASSSGISALTAQRAFSAGADGFVRETSDGGATWITRFDSGGMPLFDLDHGDFFSAMVVGANGSVWETLDGGATWQPLAGGQSGPTPAFFGLDAVDEQRAWVSSVSDGIWRTTDGGASWNAVAIDPLMQVWDVAFAANGLNGFACGTRQSTFPAFAWSNDGGLTWNSLYLTAQFKLNTVAVADAQTAIAAGQTHVMRTANGGQSWNLMSPPSPFGTYYGSDFADATTGWIAGSLIHRSDDGGLSWSFQLDPPSTLRDIDFSDSSNGWAVGDGGLVLRSTDGGATWTSQDAGAVGDDLNGVCAVNASTAWVTGEGGFIARTSDGGANWHAESVPTLAGHTLTAIDVFASGKGWLTGPQPGGIWHREPQNCTVTSYCSAKLNSAGGLASLSASGTPSASGGPFAVLATGALPDKPALLFFSATGPASTPFLGGLLCGMPPLQRLGVKLLDGAGALSYTIDVNTSMSDSLHWYQLWYRDPANSDGTGVGLSDALEVRFCP
jgi:photosystem II stability/assembly factor-like uncharacterized protein